MEILKVTAIFYSATGNTKKVVIKLAQDIADRLGIPVDRVDFTLPARRENRHSYTETDLIIFGMPVYAGRIPNKLLSYVQNGFLGGGALVLPVAVFGNRNFDSALAELKHELERNGFHMIAGAAVPTNHVFSDKIAAGRPDQKDWDALRQFAAAVADKIKESPNPPASVDVPGDNSVLSYYTPLGVDGKPTVFLKAKPRTIPEKCDGCGICAALCPMGAISHQDPEQVPGTCIKCHACVKRCPTQAKYFDDESFLSHVAMLEEHYTRRFEPVFIL